MRNNILQMAMMIDGSGFPLTEDSVQYRLFNELVSDEQAEIALAMQRRNPVTLEEIAEKSGKALEETKRIVNELMVIGIVEDTHENGYQQYVIPIIVPGILENMVLNKEQFAKHPVIGEAFEALTYIPSMVIPAIPEGGVGVGMRVIPIETALPSGQKTATYNQISYWLKKYDYIAAIDCQCRATTASMGKGCGHTIKDMCLYVGDPAEYVVKTGRGRRVSYEEAMDIMKKGEEEGLMHNISNVDGPDHVFTICNCCRCSCNGLKSSQYYNLPNPSRSDYIAQIEADKCAACGQCVENCPANAVRLGQSLCAKTPEPEPEYVELPVDQWDEKYWSPNYRDTRINVTETGTSPCKVTCPAHISVQAYIKLAAQGKFREALELIKKENPLPAICGRICPHKCESECTRNVIDEAVAIDEIKKFIADRDMSEEDCFIPEIKEHKDIKMAVIGSGPAGLSCAYYLALSGYKVTVFEKKEKLGGMLTLGIPSFRLEKKVVEAEIDILKKMGIGFWNNIEVGKDITIENLREQGYKAFFLGIGAQNGRELGVEGEDAEGVISGVDFLRTINSDRKVDLTGKTVVVGGGNVAIDVARSAVRNHTESVSLYCLESASEMPALPEEQQEAKDEGISINNGWGPKRILIQNGKVTGIEFKKCKSVFDEQHRFNPQYDEADTIIVEADHILVSIGQSVEWGNLLEESNLKLNRNNTVVADAVTYQTSTEDIFTGGDVYTGPNFAIEAIAAGKQAAISMDRFVQLGVSLTMGRNRREYTAIDKDNLNLDGFDRVSRQKVDKDTTAKMSYKDDRFTLTKEKLKEETKRCLGCGISVVDEDKCLGCGLCATKCKFDAIRLVKKYDSKFVPNEELMSALRPFVLKVNGKKVIRQGVALDQQ